MFQSKVRRRRWRWHSVRASYCVQICTPWSSWISGRATTCSSRGLLGFLCPFEGQRPRFSSKILAKPIKLSTHLLRCGSLASFLLRLFWWPLRVVVAVAEQAEMTVPSIWRSPSSLQSWNFPATLVTQQQHFTRSPTCVTLSDRHPRAAEAAMPAIL
ncbi:hypothetical protein L209DRAFT_51741 [Thermothelomyces heterothallicus CBS 203.75]